MDQVQWRTPDKNEARCYSSPARSPVCYKTPVRQSELKHKHISYQNSSGGLTILPSHITPPSGFTKFIARNPFEADLTNRLHLSVISPTVFTKVVSPSQESPGFRWTVEELARIQPARIEEFPVQQLHCSDPEIEIKAQAAISKFFETNEIIPSPWDVRRKDTKKLEMVTPTRPSEDLNSTRESHKSKRENWTQTVLSLPPDLPKSVEDALKPYFTFMQDQHVENDDANLSNSSLRRKLFFNHDDCPDDDENSISSMSPVKSQTSMELTVNCSPMQSGMFGDGSPLRRCPRKMQCNHGTPMASSAQLSPPSMSPISNNISEMSCQSIRSRGSRSVARLDFTADMSIDNFVPEDKKSEDRCESNHLAINCTSTVGAPAAHNESNESPEDVNDPLCSLENCERIKQNDTVEMVILSDEPLPVENDEDVGDTSHTNQNQEIVNKLKMAADWCKVHSNESYAFQHSNTFPGQQSTLNFAQDTDYQTNSTNNTMSMTESVNITPTKRNVPFEERLLTAEDDIHLCDWKKNMKHMFSSTPSKHNN